MNFLTESGVVTVVDEPTYSFWSLDNVRAYPFSVNLATEEQASSIHGVLLEGEPLALFGAGGGATGVTQNSCLVLHGLLYLAVGNSIVCMKLHPSNTDGRFV